MRIRLSIRKRSRLLWVLGLGAVVVLVLATGPWSTATSPAAMKIGVIHSDSRPVVTKRACVALGTCPVKDVVMRVTLPRLTYDQSQTVKFAAVLQNVGRVVCTYDGTGHGDQNMGPCGTFPLSVVDSSGANVWPGPVAYSCAMISQTRLAPGQHVLVTGTWPKAVCHTHGVESRSRRELPARCRKQGHIHDQAAISGCYKSADQTRPSRPVELVRGLASALLNRHHHPSRWKAMDAARPTYRGW